MAIQNETIDKVFEFCKDFWNKTQKENGVIIPSDLTRSHRISPGYIIILKDLNLIKHNPDTGIYKWAFDNEPTKELALQLIQFVNNKYRNSTKKKKVVKTKPENKIIKRHYDFLSDDDIVLSKSVMIDNPSKKLIDDAINNVTDLLLIAQKYKIPKDLFHDFVKDMISKGFKSK